ncbi:MAG TPA: hypothetical protein VIH06_04950, partial [Ilumatobacteraceae bacterium]
MPFELMHYQGKSRRTHTRGDVVQPLSQSGRRTSIGIQRRVDEVDQLMPVHFNVGDVGDGGSLVAER